MTDPTIDNPIDGNWYDTMAGEDAGRIEVLSQFETPEAFYTNHQEMANANWRTPFIAEGDDGKYMERFDSPAAFGKAFNEAQTTIRSGKIKADLPEGATDEDVKVYREANGIPLEPVGYYENMPEGLVLGDDDKAIADTFMGALHSVNADPKAAHALLGAYNDFAEAEQEAQAAADSTQSQEATDSLRTTWGADYRANINAVETFLTNTFGAEAKEQLMNGRFGDGRGFMNDPKILEGLASVQRQLDPLVPLIHDGNETAETSMNEEIAAIEKVMKEKRWEYNKDENMQARYRDLIDMRLSLEKKTASG